MKSILELQQHDAIACPTYEEAKAICHLLNINGYHPVIGYTWTDTMLNNWFIYNEKTIYFPIHGTYGSRDKRYVTLNSIYQASEFLNTTNISHIDDIIVQL